MDNNMNRKNRLTKMSAQEIRGKAKSTMSPCSASRRADKLTSGGSANTHSRRGIFGAFISVLMAAVIISSVALGTFADDLVNTVPGDENYRDEIHTYFGDQGITAKYGPDFGYYTSTDTNGLVRQSTSTTSGTTFAAGLPLGTIFIDQDKIGDGKKPDADGDGVADIEWITKDQSILAGLNFNTSTGLVSYKTNKTDASSAKALYSNTINEFNGDLFALTFKDAAILPDGTPANVKITYSNAKIVVDQRINSLADKRFDGEIRLVQGSSFAYGVKSTMSFNTTQETLVDNYIKNNFGNLATDYRSFKNSNASTPVVGSSMDARYQIVDSVGVPIHGTFVFAITGINLDRDPGREAQNAQKPLWYVKDFAPTYNFFSEAMSINDGQASDYIYVRSNDNALPDNPAQTGNMASHFFPHVGIDANNHIRFTSNAYKGDQANDNSYSSGFVTLANAADGFRVTGIGYGGGSTSMSADGFYTTMNTKPFSSKQIWYRYTSSTGDNGNIQITSEGNFNGKLDDGGDVLGQGTYVIAEGKTVKYTMTPDYGYKIKTLQIADASGNLRTVTINTAGDGVNKMKKGDSAIWQTADGETGELIYELDGTYTFKFPHAGHDEAIHVEWEPTTADILVSKAWYDDDDKDGMRKGADGDATKWPQVKLQRSTNGGLTWSDVTTNAYGDTITALDLPTGENPNYDPTDPTSKEYLDGVYEMDNDDGSGTIPHPYTWQYLPMYQYDSNGKTAGEILYRIVEGTPTQLADPSYATSNPKNEEVLEGYRNPIFYDVQQFNLISDETKTIDGLQIYRNAAGDEFVLQADNKYYPVTNWEVSGGAVTPQPDPSTLTAAQTSDLKKIDVRGAKYQVLRNTSSNSKYRGQEYVQIGSDYYRVIYNEKSNVAVTLPTDTAERADFMNMTNATLNGFNTADKADPYKAVAVRNEHDVSDIDVEVTKEWNDSYLWDSVNNKALDTTTPNGNAYSRRDITFTLHGTIGSGSSAKVVDLDENDPNTTDLTITLSKDELNARVQTAAGETVYIDTADDQGTKYVRTGSGTGTAPYVYFKVNSVDDANTQISGSYESTAANPQPQTSNMEEAKNAAYKVDGAHFGAVFDGLQAYYEGQLIKYTVTESFTQADSFTVTGGTITQVTETDPTTGDVTVKGYTMSDLDEVKENQDLKGYKANFTNTPIVEDEYEPLPVKIKKVDEYTGQPLANAEFTVYTDPAIDEKPDTSTYKQIDGLTVLEELEEETYTDTATDETYTVYKEGKKKYVRKGRGTDPETYDYYLYDNGSVDFTTPAAKQPTSPSISYVSTGNRYVQKSDGKYYAVTGDTIATTAANPQPDAAKLSKEKNTNYKKVSSDGVELEVWTDKKGHNYVLKNGEYFEVDVDGNVASTKADPQPTSGDLTKVEVEGEVDEIVVVTDANGEATVMFNRTGIYTIVETKAPAGYTADTDQYQFDVSKELKQVKYLGPNDDHETHWWQRLYELIFGPRTNTKDNWKQTDKRNGTLTVEDAPVTAHVLVRKIWDDANDQDGVRPNDAATLPKLTLQYTTDDITDKAVTPTWATAQVYDPDYVDPVTGEPDPKLVNVDDKQTSYAGGAIHKDNNNAYTWIDLPAYRDGKVVYYRIEETGTVLTDGTYTVTSNQTVATGEENFKLVNASNRATNQIVEVTNTHEPQILTINAVKHWLDNDDDLGHRPGTIKIALYKDVDNQETKIYELTLDGDGVKIPAESDFDLDEDGTLDDTTPVYDLDGDGTPETTEKGAYDAAKVAAEAAIESGAFEVDKTDDNTWNAIFKNLPAYANGAPIKYRLEETLDDASGAWYVKKYYASYTRTDDTSVNNETDSLIADDAKRTFVTEPVTVKVGDKDYQVYVENGKRYVMGGAGTTESPYLYYEIQTDDSVDMNTPADPQPTNPTASTITTETTEATLRVDNVSKNNADTYKYWLGGANANIRFQLYRTAVTQYVNKNDATDVISRADYNALPDAQKADYEPVVPALDEETSTADPIKSGTTITIGSDTYDVYNHANGKKYVDKSTTDAPEWHEILGKGTAEEPYSIATAVATIKINTWTPYDLDAEGNPQYVNKTNASDVITKAAYDALSDAAKENYSIKMDSAWERVTDGTDRGEHLFVSSAFNTSLVWPGDDEEHVFENLPEMDPSGNPYVYRIFETTTAGDWTDERFEGHYSDDGLTVTNINKLMEEGSANVDVLKDLSGRDWDAKYKKTGVEADKDIFYFWIEPIKGIDPDTGEIIEFTDSAADKDAKAKVPLPGDGHQYGRALSRNTAVGTTAREVSFSPILYDATDIDTSTKTSTFYYKVYEAKDIYGTIVEEKDDKGITYDGTTSNNVWKPKTEVMKVVATADDNNVVTTEHSWEKVNKDETTGDVTGVEWTTETPVFKNTYASSSDAVAWIEKNIQSREWEDYVNKKGDAFQFTITSISGANLNTPGATEDDSYTTLPLVTSTTTHNPKKDLQQLTDSMWAFGVNGNPYTGDMLGSNGEAYFIYEITENESATSDARDSLGLDKYTVDGLAYDSSKIYAKVKVTDNWDGTLSFDLHYYTDASCKSEITNHKVWIIDKILTVERYIKINDPSTIRTPEKYDALPEKTKGNYTVDPEDSTRYINNYDETDIISDTEYNNLPSGESKQDYKHDTAYQYVKKDDYTDVKTAEQYEAMSDADKAKYTNRLKRLLTKEERDAAKDMTVAQQVAAGYRQVNVVHFDNYETVDIPVKKQWIDGPAVEDVTLHLERHLFPLTDEANLDGNSGVSVVEAKESQWDPEKYINKTNYDDVISETTYNNLPDAQKANYELCGDFWERIGYVYDVERGDFLKSNGKPKYDLLPIGGKTSTKLIEDEEGFNKDLPKYVVKNGITYRAVYKLDEDDTSDAYTRAYDPQYYINENSFKDSTGAKTDALVVKNTVVAQNTANIAAVKQLQGRRWLTSDDFEFELTPYGVAVYDDNDKITRIDTTDAGKAKVPMPADDTARYSKTTTTGYVSKTDASDTKTETEYNALPDIAKSNYEQVSGDATKYVNKEDPDDIISADDYNELAAGPSKLDFVAQEKSNTHAKKGTTTVDPNGNLERLARFGEITYTAEDLVYAKTGKEHLQGDFFYLMKEKLPTIVTTGDNQLYPIEYTVVKNKGASNETTETKEIEDKAMPTLAAGETLKSVKFSNGITYDCDEHYVHVRVREDRTRELSTQIAYDETGSGTSGYTPNIANGTQFTPVYTNMYDAEALATETVNKYIMGRDWEEGETFDFLIQPLGNAPFFDKDGEPIGDNATVTIEVEDTTKKVQSAYLTSLNFSLSDLPWTVGANGAKDPRGIGTEEIVKYKDGTVVPEGTKYGRFVYAISETAASSDTVQKDNDTEYIRMTVIDKGDGTMETSVAVFEDRYCTNRRDDPEEVVYYENNEDPDNTLTEEEYEALIDEHPEEAGNYTRKTKSVPATEPAFVNQLKRDLSVTKAWAGVATSDVVLKLQWSVNGENYWDVEDTAWFNVDGTRIIKKGATGEDLTITWEDLPAYANVKNDSSGDRDTAGETGDDTALNDRWIYYQVVEEPATDVIIRYNNVPYNDGDTVNEKIEVEGEKVNKYTATPYHTGPEYKEKENPEDPDEYIKPEDRVKQLYVTNFPRDISGTTKFGVVKQYIGKTWDNEEFTFVATPYESKLGNSNVFIKNGKYFKKGDKPDEMSDEDYAALKDIIYEDEYYELSGDVKAAYTEQTNSMPGAGDFADGDNTATARKAAGVDPVSVNEYPANFKDLTIHRSDLAPDGQGGMKGEFVYKITERLPNNAVKTKEVCGKDADGNNLYYYVATDTNGNNIKYTTEEHFVHILATDDGSGKIVFTVRYDDRDTGQFVPVYTNYAMTETPVEGTKTWVGGQSSEHVNGTVTLDENDDSKVTASTDSLNLSLKRKLNKSGASEETLTWDDADRELKIVWAKITPNSETKDIYVETEDDQVDDEKTYYRYDDTTAEYSAVTPTGTENPKTEGWYEKTTETVTTYSYDKQEKGDGTYTVMAVDEDGNYVAPYLYSVDNDGNTYDYYIEEGKVPDSYRASEEGLDITNTNVKTNSVIVTKEWADGPAIEDVTLRLMRMLVPVSELEKETDPVVLSYDNLETLSETYEWKNAGLVYNAKRGDFTTETSKDYTDIEGFNKDLPMYVTEKGVDYRAIYKLVEDNTSDAYKASYKTMNRPDTGDPTEATDKGAYYLNAGDNPVVTNTVKATNEANIAAVKQLLGRGWHDTDDFEFTLEPVGKAVYDENTGEITSIDKGDDAKAAVPMPEDDSDRESATADAGTANAKSTTHARKGMTTVDENGGLERLARFGAITYTTNDLVYDPVDKHYQGDFFYVMKEKVPSPAEEGITYDTEEHTVHVKVRENRTGKLQVQIAYDEADDPIGDITTGTQFTPVFTNKIDAVTEATITKVWSDNSNKLKTRPDTLTVELWCTYKDVDDEDVHERVEKDADNKDIKHLISADDKATVTGVADGDAWKYTVDNLPKQIWIEKTEGSETTEIARNITYYWKEVVPTGYTAEASGTAVDDTGDTDDRTNIQRAADKATITNTYITGTITLTKTWDDQTNADKLRPNAQNYLPMLTLYAGNTKLIGYGSQAPDVVRSITDSGNNTYTITYSNLPVYDKNGQKITYKVEENVPEGYEIASTPAAVRSTTLDQESGAQAYTGTMSLTNKHEIELIDVEITKNWIDQTGYEHVNADTYKSRLKLFADGTDVTSTYADKLSITPTSDSTTADKFTVKWSGLPKYKVGGTITEPELEEIVYKVTETDVTGYAAATYDNKGATDKTRKSETTAAYDGGEINNTQMISVDVKKTWDDNSNHDGKRGDIKVVLFRNGVKLGEKTLKESDTNITKVGNVWTWTDVWTDLPYADTKGTTYNYTASEEAPQPWYTALFNGEKLTQILLSKWNDDKNTLIFEVTNKHDDETIGFTVDKIWDDGNDVDNVRPAKIYYRLYQDYEGIAEADKLITTLPAGASVKTATNTAGMTTTDATYSNGYVEVDAKKSDKTQGTLNRVIFEGLPKYAAGGKEITYSIEEDANVATTATTETTPDPELMFGYTTSKDGSMAAGYTVTNAHTPVRVTVTPVAKKAITGRKFKSGDEFTFKLKATGTNASSAPTPTPDWVTITPTSETEASVTFNDITFTGALMTDKLNAGDAKAFEYEVTEVKGGVEDISYSTQTLKLTVTLKREADGSVTATHSWSDGDGDNHDTITNTFNTETALIIRKVWEDKDADETTIGTRPESITVVVTAEATVDTPALVTAGFTKDDAASTDEKSVYTKEYVVSESSDSTLFNKSVWQKKIEGLPALDAADAAIKYTVDEKDVPNYTKAVKDDEGRWIIMNTYSRTTFTGTKVWDDGNLKHDNATELKDKLTLYRTTDTDLANAEWTKVSENYHIHWNGDGEAADDKYSQSFTITGLPEKAADGKAYTYRVVEDSVGDDYTTTYTNNGTYSSETKALYNGGTVTNTNQGKVTIMAKKVWEGDSEDKSKRKAIKFQLVRTVDGSSKNVGDPKDATATSETFEPIKDQDNDDYVVWKDLPTVVEGKKATYDVKEDSVPDGYTSKVEYGNTENDNWSETKPNNWNNKIHITNTLNDTAVDVPVRMVWDDNKDQDGERPDSVPVRVQVKVGDDWTEVYIKDGKLVDKTTQGATKVDDATLSKDNNWKHLFRNLPATDANGKALEYRVVEMDNDNVVDGTDGKDKLPGKSGTEDVDYTAGITGDQNKGFVITNSYLPGTVTVTVTKKWFGDNDVKSTTRKDTYFILIGHVSGDPEGQVAYVGEYKKIKVDKDADVNADAGSVTWTGLPKYIDGQELIWDVLEESIPGYTTSYGQTTGTGGKTDANNVAEFTVTNEYVGAVKEVTATKVWDDDDNRDGMRKDVKLVLYRQVGNGEKEKVDEKTISKDATGSDLTVKWTKLPEMTIGGTETTTRTETVPKYVEVDTIAGDENPSQEGWYELVNEEYVASADTAVVADKTYYKQDGKEDIEVEEVTSEATHGITYWVEEENVPAGYTSVITQKEPGVFEAKNIHVPETTDIYVTKVWNDENDEERIRPDHLTFRLKANGTNAKDATITSKDEGWNEGKDGSAASTKHVFTGLPKYEDGQEITYSVVELDADDSTELDGTDGKKETSYHYIVSPITGSGSEANPYVIVNTYNPSESIKLTVKKKWVGDDKVKKTSRKDVDITLVEVIDGARKEGETITLKLPENVDDEMSYTWENLDATYKHQPVSYTVAEKDIPEGYTVNVSDTKEISPGVFEVEVTNTYHEVIPSEDVIYVDPKNPSGKMVVKSTTYDSPSAASAAANNKTGKPGDPKHKGVKFVGWDVNYDDNGNYVLVATYSDIPSPVTPVVSYIDPQSGKVLVSKQTDDPSSVKAPADPKSKNMQFTGWAVVTDAAGNTMYLAQYECDCSNGSGGKDVDKSNVDTSDDAMLTVWMLLFVMAVSFMVLTMMLRNRSINAVRDTYKPKH